MVASECNELPQNEGSQHQSWGPAEEYMVSKGTSTSSLQNLKTNETYHAAYLYYLCSFIHSLP